MHVALLGCGYWGVMLLDKLIKNKSIECITVFCKSGGVKIADRYRQVIFTDSERDVFENDKINMVFIALPARLHYDFAKKSLLCGKHVFLEKPMAHSYEKACEINSLAASCGLTVMVDHTFLYTPQIRRIRSIIDSGAIGEIRFYDSIRVAFGNLQRDVNVAWDLAVHDLAILDYLFDERPESVSASGSTYVYGSIATDVRATLFYGSGFTANIKVSWNFPEKVRDIFIGGSKKIIKYDDSSPDEKLKVYNYYYGFDRDDAVYYVKDGYTIEETDKTDAIETAIREFIECCGNGCVPLSSGVRSINYINILEKIDISMKNRGREVMI